MGEALPDPALGWEHTPQNQATIDFLVRSNNPLYNAYGEAYQQRCFVVEMSLGGHEFANVGELDAITLAEEQLGVTIGISKLGISECIALGTKPGKGATRPERIRDGLRQVLAERAAAAEIWAGYRQLGISI